MVDRRRRLLAALARTTPTSEGHRATTFELLFDLVYVFAATQVTALVAEHHSPHGVAQGLILLALLLDAPGTALARMDADAAAR